MKFIYRLSLLSLVTCSLLIGGCQEERLLGTDDSQNHGEHTATLQTYVGEENPKVTDVETDPLTLTDEEKSLYQAIGQEESALKKANPVVIVKLYIHAYEKQNKEKLSALVKDKQNRPKISQELIHNLKSVQKLSYVEIGTNQSYVLLPTNQADDLRVYLEKDQYGVWKITEMK